MPLSEREQALLEQMEQALYAEDPRFAAQLANPSQPRRRSRLVIGVLGVVAGLGIVLLGVTMQQIWVGVLGFLVMVAAGVYALTTGTRKASLGTVREDGSVQHHTRPRRRLHRPGTPQGGPSGHHPRQSGTFMQRLEKRWDDRRERGDF